MVVRQATLGPKKLRQVALPGTHDSGTFGISASSAFAADESGSKFPEIVHTGRVVAGIAAWAIAQGLNFGKQLAAGIRYFDLRTQWYNGDFVFVHGPTGTPVKALLNSLKAFLSGPKFDHELVILDFNHFYAMGATEHTQLAMLLKEPGPLAVPPSIGTDVTLRDIWQGSGRVPVFYDDAPTCTAHSFL
jgi:hypothetical protein